MITNLTNRSIVSGIVNLPREHHLSYGAVINIFRPRKLGNCYLKFGCLWETGYTIFRNSFDHDGDLYGHGEAMLYTGSPIMMFRS